MSDPANPFDSPREKSRNEPPARNHRGWVFGFGMVLLLGVIVAAGLAYWYFVELPLRRYYGV